MVGYCGVSCVGPYLECVFGHGVGLLFVVGGGGSSVVHYGLTDGVFAELG